MEDNFIEAMEMVDLYCQTLLARYGLLQAHKYGIKHKTKLQ
jgi:hypothetical protein